MRDGRTGMGRGRRSSLRLWLILGVGVLLIVFIPPNAFFPGTAPVAPNSAEFSTFLTGSARVASIRGLVVTGPSATSSGVPSSVGDTVVVFVSVYGGSVVGVTDSASDAFHLLTSVPNPSKKTVGAALEVFAAYNIGPGPTRTVSISLSGPTPLSAAVDIVDVTGVGPTPAVTLGIPMNYTSATQPADATSEVVAGSSNLLLAGIAAVHTHAWTAIDGASLLDDTHQPLSGAAVTAADFSSASIGPGPNWVNATTTSNSTDWVSDALAFTPLATNTSAVTFSETGLSARHAWYVNLGGAVNSTKSTSLSFVEPAGTYSFEIGTVSGYVASPAAGTITVAGTPTRESIVFGPDTSDWSTYLGGVTRNAATTTETALSPTDAQNLSPLWTSYSGHVQSEPAVVHGIVYAGAINGYEYAVNATTGATVWKTYIGQVTQPNCAPDPTGITSSATVSAGVVYVGGGNTTGNLTNGMADWYALNASTGAILWTLPIGNAGLGYYNWASPLIADGNAYIGVASRCDEPLVWGGVLQVSLTTHAVLGFFNTTVGGGTTRGSSVWGSPTFDAANNTIFFATGNPFKTHVTNYSESVVAINATTLAPVGTWQIPAAQVANVSDADFGTTPDYFHLPNGTPMITALNKNGILYALNPTQLSAGPVWQSYVTNSMDPPGVDPAAFGGGLLYEGGGATTLAGVNVSGAIRAYYPGNGTVKWHQPMEGDVLGAPIYSNGVLVVAGGPVLDVLNASSGAVLWNWTCSTWILSAPTVAEGRIFVGCHNLYAFGFTGALPAGRPLAPGPATPWAYAPAPMSSPGPSALPFGPVRALPERWLAPVGRAGV
jgi:outer membrane protein assembly factor BamB